MIITQTSRLQICTWSQENWPSLLPIASDPLVLRHVGDGQPWTPEKTRNWVAKQVAHQASNGFSRYRLIDNSGQLVGWCGLDYFGTTGEVELGFWIAQQSWGQGLATEAARAVLQHARLQLMLERVISVCTPANLGSRNVMEKIGLTFEREVSVRALGVPLDITVLVYASPMSSEGAVKAQ